MIGAKVAPGLLMSERSRPEDLEAIKLIDLQALWQVQIQIM